MNEKCAAFLIKQAIAGDPLGRLTGQMPFGAAKGIARQPSRLSKLWSRTKGPLGTVGKWGGLMAGLYGLYRGATALGDAVDDAQEQRKAPLRGTGAVNPY